MKEKPSHNPRDKSETGQAPSFFKIDPQNWPDIPPPPIKSKRRRNPYKLLGVAHFTDEVIQRRKRSMAPPRGWKIPQSKRAEPTGEIPIEKPIPKEESVEDKRMRTVRLRAKELMQELHSGKVERSQVLLFYKNNATAFILHRAYECYRDYAVKHRLKIMSWPEYARERILERFSEDFYAFRKWR